MKFTIDGKPQGKARPRLSRYGTYTPQKTKDYEQLVKYSYLQVSNKMWTSALKIKIYAYFKTPKSMSKKKQNELIGTPYIHKPDSDNIAKIILDGLNGVAYLDDNQVTTLEVHKIYSKEEYTEVEILKESN